jgi:hypothetical protein
MCCDKRCRSLTTLARGDTWAFQRCVPNLLMLLMELENTRSKLYRAGQIGKD